MVLWENHGKIWEYPLVNIQIAIENGLFEIVDFDLPSYKMVDLSSSLCFIVYQAG